MTNVLPSILFQVYPTPNTPQKTVDVEVNQYLAKSAQLAKQILAPSECGYTQENRNIGRVQVNNYNFGSPSCMPMMIPLHTAPVYHVHTAPHYHVHHNPQHARQEKEGPSDGLRWIVGLAAAVMGGFAIYKVGQIINHIRAAGEELDENRQFQGRIRDWNYSLIAQGQGDSAALRALKTISEKRQSIFSRIKENAVLNLIIAISTVATAIFAIAGAVVGSWALLGLGLASGLAVAGSFLFKIGYASSDKNDVKDAQVLKEQIDLLKGPSYYQNILVEANS
ncbi:hypothetical protein [Estrella lausannensis]|uniref:Conserved putative membrane protein n=1 Tax=Estrella lausannensis TaxID=483423 RepID=A0A0H5DU17_9BACT|nr:hypothetical protein [Estrella lausannensis]CRX39394.1 Conserved putative membrane protein [Estrella lausannensis]